MITVDIHRIDKHENYTELKFSISNIELHDSVDEEGIPIQTAERWNTHEYSASVGSTSDVDIQNILDKAKKNFELGIYTI